tara:strand:- start:1830 stop:2450 length:621 start_codon:yes stop_codon:yes gene_type:complete
MKKKSKRTKKNKRDNDSESDSDCDSDNSIKVSRNHIYFWCDVSKETALDLTLKINDACHDVRSLTLFGDDPTPVYIHINSYGGDLDAALGVVDTIESLKATGATIITIIEGHVASAATLISVVGTERRIRPNAIMRIHNFSTGLFGKKNEIDEEFANLGQLENILLDFYKKHTSMNRQQLKRLMARETDLRADDCLAKGLVDNIQQ